MRDSYQDNAAGTEPVEGTTEVVTEPRSLRNRWSADEDRQLVELVARRGVPASGKWAELEGTIRGENSHVSAPVQRGVILSHILAQVAMRSKCVSGG
eukprot:SAG31_NODE_493_length_14893_cov_20.429701_3_plen_97_part_00